MVSTWPSTWPLSGWPRLGLQQAGRGVWAGSYCWLAVNKQQKTELLGSLFGGCVGESGGLAHSWQEGEVIGCYTLGSTDNRSHFVVPPKSPSHWLLVPGHTSVLGQPLHPRTVSTHSHSLCSFYFNEEVIKSMYNLKTVEKVSKKAPKSIRGGDGVWAR